jgi:four helix bundle protein
MFQAERGDMGHNYRDLIVWQRAIELAKLVYQVTECFPKHELYGLAAQVRRAAVSVPSNIAEGQGRLSRKGFRQFLGQARGSLLELETQIVIARELGYLTQEAVQPVFNCSDEVSRLLHGLITSMSRPEGSSGNWKLETGNS